MANWCEGTLKIRGERKDIVDFLRNGLEMEDTDDKPEVIDNEDGIELITDYKDCYVKNTNRGFIRYELYYAEKFNLIVANYYQAWSVNIEELASISECYNLDFKILAKEPDCALIQDIEIHKGVIVRDFSKSYVDYASFIWDAPDLIND